ncbi:MAG TPA: VWA domain-containing protein [Candidatus Acidoferrales bacterium]|jgi:Ca-activated chloride channel family protein|nr:VWA domain-containing protein [Candidatus Acidoferrales bacterium]
MVRKSLLSLYLVGLFIFIAYGGRIQAQESPDLHVVVNLVQLNVAVTDKSGNYITGLRPKDFAIVEDGIQEKVATFAEGNEPVLRVTESGETEGPADLSAALGKDSPATGSLQTLSALVAGANVFVLFDTSNYMYHGFVFAQDAIAEFVRSLGSADKIAFYSYNRDLSRAASLTADRGQVLHAVRSTVAGDEAALYNTLLLTLKDATQYEGRKVVVVFSNGPDNSSVVPPEDVAEFAQSAGVSIYMISTQDAKLEPVSTAVFDRMTAATGGKAYFAKNWRDEKRAFASIRDDLAHLYSLSYYPKANANSGWRAITVKLVGDRLKKYKIRTRNGYRPQPSRFSSDAKPIKPVDTPQYESRTLPASSGSSQEPLSKP